ncbi:MAG: Xaa-Pro peptidase family protein [Pseudomonadota bacterium]
MIDANEPTPPPRGFPESEFRRRISAFQRAMQAAEVGAVILTTESEIRYFSGFSSQFWQSPTRPWFLVIPGSGKPIAVIPTIGEVGMRATWIDDIRTWPAPRPDDDGVSALVALLSDIVTPSGAIGVALGHESHLRMPADDFADLRHRLTPRRWLDVRPALRRTMAIKSQLEIDKIRYICQVASGAFERLPARLAIGMSEREACRAMQIELLASGADDIPYLIGASGPAGYDNIIMGPTERVMVAGDIFIIDTGARFDGYFCDFDRNFAFGDMKASVRRAYETVYVATDAGFDVARVGNTTYDVWSAMCAVLKRNGARDNAVGRMGHGLGSQLTEWPSNAPTDPVILEAGMVITLEPGLADADGRLMVHEENIAITEDGPIYLTRRAPSDMPVIT